jgi:hypothetical protein
MASSTILQLPPLVAITGQEWIEAVQNGTSGRMQIMQILSLFGGNSFFAPLPGAPSSPFTGQAYFDTTLGYPRVWTGSAWHGILLS